MSSFFFLLQRVHDKVHDSAMKLNYSDPKIYTGSVDVTSWSKFSTKEKKIALSKSWYVYYSFRNPKTGKLERQTNIKAGVNLYKDKRRRYHILKQLRESLKYILSKGFNPYEDNSSLEKFIEELLLDKKDINKIIPIINESHSEKEAPKKQQSFYSIKDAFDLALKTKSKVLNPTSYQNFSGRINRFSKWLVSEKIDLALDILTINKKLVIQYLNTVLQSTSPRNRNNTRTDISSLFQTLEDNEVIQDNFVKNINVLKSVPERNKTYTTTEQKEIFKYLKKYDTICIVESEKTAIIMSILLPNFHWLATGSKTSFKYEMLQPIKDYRVIAYPDKTEYQEWNKMSLQLNRQGFKIQCSNILEKIDLKDGEDLIDYLNCI